MTPSEINAGLAIGIVFGIFALYMFCIAVAEAIDGDRAHPHRRSWQQEQTYRELAKEWKKRKEQEQP